MFALRHRIDLILQARGQLADKQRHDQHDREGDQVFRIADGKGKTRVYKKEIKQPDADEGSQNGGSPTVGQGNANDGEQKEHDDVGQFKHVDERRGQQRRESARGKGGKVASPACFGGNFGRHGTCVLICRRLG